MQPFCLYFLPCCNIFYPFFLFLSNSPSFLRLFKFIPPNGTYEEGRERTSAENQRQHCTVDAGIHLNCSEIRLTPILARKPPPPPYGWDGNIYFLPLLLALFWPLLRLFYPLNLEFPVVFWDQALLRYRSKNQTPLPFQGVWWQHLLHTPLFAFIFAPYASILPL